jgi:lipoprotein NlpI
MKTRLALLYILMLSVTLVVQGVAADDRSARIALVIGNAKYPDADAPLKEPINDAHDVADELKRDGFDVDIGENLSGEAMRRTLDRLYGKIKPGSVVLIFFSGFGIQSGRQSYMIPVDAQIWTEPDVRRDGFSLETILGEINSRGAGVKIALLDASRRNPFERRFRSFSAGLAPVIAPSGTLVMYSAALSSVVSDSGAEHSLFVGELLKEIRVPDLMAEETLNRTRVGVTRASHAEQVPWISSSLAEDFSFVPGPSTQTPPAATATPAIPPVAVAKAPVAAPMPPRADPVPPPREEASKQPPPIAPPPAPPREEASKQPPPITPPPAPPPREEASKPPPPITPPPAPPPREEASKPSPPITPPPAPPREEASKPSPPIAPPPAPPREEASKQPPPIAPPPAPPREEASKQPPPIVPPPAPPREEASKQPPPSAPPPAMAEAAPPAAAPAAASDIKDPGKDEANTVLALADDPTIKDLTNRLANNPDDANALYRRGQVYASKGAYALAIKDFGETIRINPKDVEAFNNRCWARTVIGDLQPALKDCNEALRLRPNFVDALDSRGLLNLKNGQTKNAIADFDAALKINPRLTSSLYGRGLAKRRGGNTAEGDLDIANAKAMDPDIVKEFAGYGVR